MLLSSVAGIKERLLELLSRTSQQRRDREASSLARLFVGFLLKIRIDHRVAVGLDVRREVRWLSEFLDGIGLGRQLVGNVIDFAQDEAHVGVRVSLLGLFRRGLIVWRLQVADGRFIFSAGLLEDALCNGSRLFGSLAVS